MRRLLSVHFHVGKDHESGWWPKNHAKTAPVVAPWPCTNRWRLLRGDFAPNIDRQT